MGGAAPAKGYGNASRHTGALTGLRICDLSGQLAGAGATRMLAAFGAQVIRVEDPVTNGLWDIVRQMPPKLNDDQSHEGGAGFNNHNVEKLGVTIDLRQERGKALLRELVASSDAVTENFAAGVMERLGFGYDDLKAIKPDIVYVSNSGFGHTGPYRSFKSWGPIVQAVSGLTWASGLPDQEPAGWGYSYMDHTGGYVMAIALNGPTLLDVTVNGRTLRGEGQPDSNRSASPAMAPHGVYPCAGEDTWAVVACRHDEDWRALAGAVDEPWADPEAPLAARLADQDRLDADLGAWTGARTRDEVVAALRAVGVPSAPVLRPSERCRTGKGEDPWGLWPQVEHTRHGAVAVDGLPVHLSGTDWQLERGGPLLGEHNDRVLTEVLGKSPEEIASLRDAGVI